MAKTIVFQGDSITDAWRNEDAKGIGKGFIKIVADWLDENHPNVTYYNRGISGNRVKDLVNRWDADTLSLKPDVVTIMIGVNNVLHSFYEHSTITPNEEFERDYTEILKKCKQQGIKVIMMQPFSFAENVSCYTPAWDEEMRDKKAICDKLAQIYAHSYIRTDEEFARLQKLNPQVVYAGDGVHPTEDGKAVMAKLLIAQLSKVL